MADTYVLLSKVTVGSTGASSVTFSNIPQTGYTDLVIKCSVRSDRASSLNSYMRLYPNGSSSSITLKALTGNGSSAGSQTESAASAYVGEINASTSTASTFSNVEIYIPNYAGSTNKSYSVDAVMENNATTAYVALVADLWSNTTAISSIQLLDALGNFVQYSDFYLYGISNVNTTPTVGPAATGGDIITNDGTYWIHTFLSSGTFTPLKALSCDYLVVAGGGGGGNTSNNYGGGGGAGGLRSTVTATGGGGSLESKLSLTTTNYTVTIGAGGAGVSVPQTYTGGLGSDSVFSTITSKGGGGGALSSLTGGNSNTGVAGGSGGGGTGNAGVGGAGTANQGYAGGGSSSGANGGGGGGGAGAVGANGTGSVGGNGGNGVATSISGSSVTYAGGGGGAGTTPGTGGTGGGGNGTNTTSSNAGNANTGGGGGSCNGGTSGAGGSGIVIVRYAM